MVKNVKGRTMMTEGLKELAEPRAQLGINRPRGTSTAYLIPVYY